VRHLLIAASLLVLAPAALAVPVRWELNDFTFFDGTLAVGGFSFDADTGLVSDVDISTSPGVAIVCDTDPCGADFTTSAIGGADYSFGGVTAADPTGLFFITKTGDLTGSPLLFLRLATPLTNAGGSVDLPTGFSVEFVCAEPICNNTFDVLSVPFRSNVEGASVRAVPEPSTLLLGLGLIAFAFVRTRGTPAVS